MIELAEQPTQQHVDVLTGVGDLIERLRKQSIALHHHPDTIDKLVTEALNKLEAIADELIDAQTKLALALSREQELIDELIPLKGERALLNTGKEYKRYKINTERKIDDTQVATREEGSLDATELYKQFKTTLSNQVTYLPKESLAMTPNSYRSEVFLDTSTNYKYEFEFADSDYPWYVRRVKFEG